MDTQYIHYDPVTHDVLGWYFTAHHSIAEIPTTNVLEVTEQQLGEILGGGYTKYNSNTLVFSDVAEGIFPDVTLIEITPEFHLRFQHNDNGESAARDLLRNTQEEVLTAFETGATVSAQTTTDRAAARALLAASSNPNGETRQSTYTLLGGKVMI